MYRYSMIGRAKRFTAAGVSVLSTGISSTAGAGLIGVMNNASVTGATTIQLWAGLTATSTAAVGSAGAALTGIITFVSATGSAPSALCQFIQVPAYASGGLVLNIAGDANPDVTLFWNPA